MNLLTGNYCMPKGCYSLMFIAKCDLSHVNSLLEILFILVSFQTSILLKTKCLNVQTVFQTHSLKVISVYTYAWYFKTNIFGDFKNPLKVFENVCDLSKKKLVSQKNIFSEDDVLNVLLEIYNSGMKFIF